MDAGEGAVHARLPDHPRRLVRASTTTQTAPQSRQLPRERLRQGCSSVCIACESTLLASACLIQRPLY
ncbi:hypothetical protein ACFPRL_26260 [Pseudoclavibacter helvolus]